LACQLEALGFLPTAPFLAKQPFIFHHVPSPSCFKLILNLFYSFVSWAASQGWKIRADSSEYAALCHDNSDLLLARLPVPGAFGRTFEMTTKQVNRLSPIASLSTWATCSMFDMSNLLL
jgi:hypothetical protein